jgi:hypothetical protein
VRVVGLGFLSTALILAANAAADPPYVGLPDGALLLEDQPVPVWAHPHRALVLWIWPSEDKPLHWRSDFNEMGSIPEEGGAAYTCPEQATGHSHFYYSRTRVSLVDTQSRHVLNTLPVQIEDARDEFEIPFLIRSGYYYEVPGPLQQGVGKPHILALKDLNGDGKALEFVFYWMESCSGPATKIYGYSQRQDRVILYEFRLTDRASGKQNVEAWMRRFTLQTPVAPMHWVYDDTYNTGGSIRYDFRYVPERERFEGTELRQDPATGIGNPQKKK